MGIYPQVRNSPPKGGAIPHVKATSKPALTAMLESALGDEPAAYQLVGGVNAYQGYDGYRVLAHVPAEGH